MNFDPVMGFQGRHNFTRHGARLTYGWISDLKSKLSRHSAIYRGVFFWSNELNKLETYNGSLAWEFLFKLGFAGAATIRYQYEFLQETLELTDESFILPGTYEAPSLVLALVTPEARSLSLATEMTVGRFYDGSIFSLALTPNYAVSASLELSATYEFNRLNFSDRGLLENIHVGRLKALYMLDTKFSISSFIQYNSTISTYLANIRLRYNPREGNDLFLVYNDDFNTNRDRDWPVFPRLPLSNQRAVMLKYTYTFRL